jgi:hypothetical protein
VVELVLDEIEPVLLIFTLVHVPAALQFPVAPLVTVPLCPKTFPEKRRNKTQVIPVMIRRKFEWTLENACFNFIPNSIKGFDFVSTSKDSYEFSKDTSLTSEFFTASTVKWTCLALLRMKRKELICEQANAKDFPRDISIHKSPLSPKAAF